MHAGNCLAWELIKSILDIRTKNIRFILNWINGRKQQE